MCDLDFIISPHSLHFVFSEGRSGVRLAVLELFSYTSVGSVSSSLNSFVHSSFPYIDNISVLMFGH